MKADAFKIFMLALLLGTAIRIININQPLLEYNATRQVETAMIVRNFMNGGFNFLYPETDDNGKGPSYLMQEFPIIAAPLSVACSFMGNIPAWLLRGSSLVFFILAALFLYRLAERCYGGNVALISALIFIFSPLSILMSRTFQPDMAMIFFIISCFYYFLRWQESGKWPYLIFAIIGFTFSILLKVTNLYIVLPVLFLIFTNRKKGAANYWIKVCFFFLVSFIPVWWWWGYHSVAVRNAFPIPQTSTFNLKYITSSMMFFLTHPPFYAEIFKYIVMAALTPVIFIAFLYGLFFKKQNAPVGNFIYVWLLGVILFFAAVPELSKQEYYMFSLVPAASIFAAMGIILIFEKARAWRMLRWAIASAVAVTMISIAYVTIPKYINRPVYGYIIEAGKAADRITEKGAVIVASHGYGPDLLYYCNRKGWAFLINREELKKYFKGVKTDLHKEAYLRLVGPAQELENLRKKGASYFVVADTTEFDKNAEFNDYMNRNYKCVERKGSSYAIFDLRKKAT